ncbi:aspartate/glutamate racemase family protein [Pseudodesulfovibrio sediminis]|uniref:Racemase n=1 Tax=Pseudodesulfovibrio sediminis TaxID=2810563 RepID=A0ABM7P4L6_9BACT|nr:aspartate/glutamate racemase family protein [Pseudodesulfovibrio sediminis]BCS87845.1 racemase [Pseudodesulfovibrio sediminis]
MKTIGLLGGMSWESTVGYYQVMNQAVKERLGGLHSARILLFSVDFQVLRDFMVDEDWDAVAAHLADAARTLEQGGADMIVIGTNTMHKVAPQIADAVSVPVVHIADATAQVARTEGYAKVGLLGTIFTMEDDFYTQRLEEQGLEVIVPGAEDRKLVDRVIFDELCKGELCSCSRTEYLRILDAMAAQGAQAVILGCTEIGLLVRPGDTDVPTLDTCRIHAVTAVEEALK